MAGSLPPEAWGRAATVPGSWGAGALYRLLGDASLQSGRLAACADGSQARLPGVTTLSAFGEPLNKELSVRSSGLTFNMNRVGLERVFF